MADFTALKNSIQTYIKQNGNEEITGEILQEILLSMVTTLGDSAINDLVTALANEVAARQNADGTLQQNITNEATARGNADTALGGRIDDEATARANGDTALSNRLGSTITAENTAADQIGAEAEARAAADTALQELIDGITNNIANGYVYAGIATPSSTPATGKVFYLALTAGTYTNFGSTVVSQGINILKYNGSAWSLDAFIGIDDELTPGSNKLPKSGTVLENIIKNGSALDLSAYNAVDGVPAAYADLDAALTALNALPAVYKQGGMSFRFVRTSDNKYVQYRLMAQDFTTDVTQWQGVDKEPVAGSKNLVQSGGIHLLDFAKPYIHAYAGNADIGGKYYGKYCSNVNTGAISDATETRDSYLIQATAGIKYLIICPSRVYSGIQFFDEDFGFVGSVSFNTSGITAPPDSRYMMIVVNPSLEDQSCTIKALEIIDEEKLSSSLKTKINLPLTGYIYDVSQKFPTGGVSGGNTYTLQGAIDTIPSADRYAGMIIRFVHNETQLYQKWMFIGKTVSNNTWNVYNFENCDKEDDYVADGMQSYSGSINLNGKYYGLYCLNVNTGEQRIATETRNSYLLRIIPGQRYKITCPSKVYEYWLQFYKSKPKQSNSAYSDTEGFVGKDKPTDGVFVAPANSHYLSITVNPSLENQSCIVEAIKTVDEDKLNDELREKINNPSGINSKGFLYGKKLVTLCDSFGEGGTWQSKLVELTGCVWDSELNYQHYSRGGTKTLYAPQQLQDGQGRAKLLVDENLVTPDVIIYENMNDNSGLVTGTSADEPFFRYSQQLITPSSAIASQVDAETYWNNNLLTIVGGITPHNGVILGVPYSASNGVKLKITGTPTQNGTFTFRIGTGYGITLTTSDTISDIVRKILEYDYYGYLDTVDPSDDSAVIFNNLDGTTVGELIVLSNTAGITYEITSNVPGQLAVWKYFYGHDLTKWTNGEYWRNEITRWSMWKGVIEYLQTSFPSAMIYWMLPRTYNFDYNNLPAAALFPDGSVNYSYIYENYNLYESICEIEKQFCEFYHIPLLDLPAYSGINPMNASELCNAGNVHPKDAAYNRWAEIIAQQIN